MSDYEYVVWDNVDNEIHRGPWPEAECIAWIDECRDMFPNAEPGAVDKWWSVRRRSVGEWESL